MIISREQYLQRLIAKRDNGRVKVITGIRRCGKSENVIFNELCVRGFSVDVGIVAYNYKGEDGKSKRRQVEVDFVVNKINKRYYIQSAFAIPDDVKRDQETNSLRRINDSYQRIVVQRDLYLPYYDENGIYYISLEDFLLKYIDTM